MQGKITEFRIQASANASDSVPIETAHEDMIVSRDMLAKREGFIMSTRNFLARCSAGLLWKTPCNLFIGSYRESV